MHPPHVEKAERLVAYSIRFVMSPQEYKNLVANLEAKKNTEMLHYNMVAPSAVEKSAEERGDFAQATTRAGTRTFLRTHALVVAIVAISRLINRQKPDSIIKDIIFNKTGLRIASSTSSILVAFRLCDRLLTSTREYILQPQSRKFRKKHRLFTRWIVSERTPTFFAALAGGLFLVIYPRDFGRSYIALYTASKACEFFYNFLDDRGYTAKIPRWLGSWVLFPLAYGQLFSAFFFHPETVSPTFSKYFLKLSVPYLPSRPEGYSGKVPWPTPRQFVDGIALIAKQRYPKFNSPIVYPDSYALPANLTAIEPVVSGAHPILHTLSGALLHPHESSELPHYLKYISEQFIEVGKKVLGLHLILGFLRRKGKSLSSILSSSVSGSIRTTAFLVLLVSNSWAGIGLMQKFLGNRTAPVDRFRFIGMLSGLWAMIDQSAGRGRWMYTARMGVMSYWNELVKRKVVKPIPHGDVYLFAVSLAVILSLLQKSPESISGPGLRKTLNWFRSNEYVDPVKLEDLKEKSA
ncbi:hypothetical protein CJU90_6482 [Yarrowia sp. C11]|nr:hypothetical protein CJU90_6482 [Yarrowia sp. C11]KAG5371183.1 hypothetical protein CKK34_1323 [Yarrowia sp. E02]